MCLIHIQRAVHKTLISVFLSREFKHDETNRAWWTGRWYGRGLGAHVMSQPAREFIVKIIELSLWSSDLLLGHLLQFMLTPPILIPYFDRLHATLLCKSRLFIYFGVIGLSNLFSSLAAAIKADPSSSLLY
jgi:1,3-beta-glucan synthase